MSLAQNKKAFFDYEILETLEAGLILTGQEVKSAKNGSLNLKGAFVTFHNSNAYLTNCHISPYPFAGKLPDYSPTQSRRLLLHKKQVKYLQGKSLEKGLTILPIEVYTKSRFVKVKIAVARGKHQYDKREAIKKRDAKRELQRALK